MDKIPKNSKSTKDTYYAALMHIAQILIYYYGFLY